MPIVSVPILAVVAISIVWAFKTGCVKALSEGYVFSFTEGTGAETMKARRFLSVYGLRVYCAYFI